MREPSELPLYLRRRVGRRQLLRSAGLAGLGLGAIAIVGCGDDDDEATGTPRSPQATDPSTGGHLRIAWGLGDPRFLNPLLSNSILEHYSVAPGYDTLLQYDPLDPSVVIGSLASEWESPDPSTFIFHLVETNWHDGEPFTAADVKYTYDRTLDENDPEAVNMRAKRNIFGAVESIDVTDDRTVQFNLSRPQVTLPSYLAWGVCAIIPEHLTDADLESNVVGTGPFILDRFEPGTGIFYTRNPEYWNEGLPLLDELSVLYITDEQARVTAIQGGRIDACALSVTGAEGLGGDIVVDIKNILQAQAITASRRNPRFTDERIQRALFLCWDRQAAIEVTERGQASLGAALPPGHITGGLTKSSEDLVGLSGYRDDKEEDRAEARALLSEAAFPEGSEVKVMVETSGAGGPSPVAEFALDQLSQIGLNGVFDPVDTATEAERRASGEFDTFVGGGVAFVPEPLGSRGFWQAPNDAGYENEQVEQLVADIDAAVDEDERTGLIAELEDLLLEEPPYSVIFWREQPVAHASNVQLPLGLGFAQGLALTNAAIEE